MDAYFTLFVFTVAIAAAIGFALLLVGYIVTIPGAIAHGWRWGLIAIVLPLFGPLWFARRHWPDFSRPGKQLAAGAILLIFAATLLYGAGPLFAERIIAGYSKAQSIPIKP